MHRYRLLTILILFLSALVSARAIVIRHDRDDARYLELAKEFKAYVDVVDAGGTLIDPRWVLTAGHVAREITPFSATAKINGKRYIIDRIIFHPDYVQQRGGRKDLSLLRLSQPVTDVQPVGLYRNSDEVGQTVNFFGRGMKGNGNTGPTGEDGKMRGATNKLERADNASVFFQFDKPETATDLEGISGPGDSGGPALLKVDGKWAIAGVSSANMGNGFGLCKYGTTEVYARVSTEVAWIEKTLKDSLPSTPLWSKPTAFKAWPKTRQGEVAEALIIAYNSGKSSTMETFNLAFRDPSVLTRRTPAQRAEGYENSYRRSGAITVQMISTDITGRMVLMVKGDKGFFQLSLFFLDPAATRFDGYYIGDAVPPED
ncbi:MAG: trypsin-like serine protease [Chlorobia bacterium]|nr:trypsin-like serine protease [Fimbriimonadaceae bacterium]